MLGCAVAETRPADTLTAELTSSSQPSPATTPAPPVPFAAPAAAASDKPLPINLPSALQLAHAGSLDIAVASQRIQVAAAQLARANVLWLPTLQFGIDYFRHDGRIQDVQGNLLDTNKSTFMVGGAPIAVFAVSDAVFGPLAARQVVQARQAGLQAATNDTTLAVAEAYFNVQQARGQLAGALDAVRHTEDLLARTERLKAQGRGSEVEVVRVRTELSQRRSAVTLAREQWQVASAELTRLLRLDPSALVEPAEPPHIEITLVSLDKPVDDLISVGLTSRPELRGQQAIVRATLAQLRQERLRPLVPSVLLRGAATNPAGTLAAGAFGGGRNGEVSDFGARSDFDLQVIWELQNLGFGYTARVRERRAEYQLALLESLRLQDRVASEVVQAYQQGQSAASRVREAERGLKDAVYSATENIRSVSEPKRVGNLDIPVIRPQEATAAIQALVKAYFDYYGAVADYNRAQFRLYRALGQPAQMILDGGLVPCSAPPAQGGPSSDLPASGQAPQVRPTIERARLP
jgi:outer membrane protein TolC